MLFSRGFFDGVYFFVFSTTGVKWEKSFFFLFMRKYAFKKTFYYFLT